MSNKYETMGKGKGVLHCYPTEPIVINVDIVIKFMLIILRCYYITLLEIKYLRGPYKMRN